MNASVPEEDAAWFRRQLHALPTTYLSKAKHHQVIEDLSNLRLLKDQRAIAWGRFAENRNVNIYKVGLHQTDVRNVFHRLVGVLTQKGMQILAAHQHRLEDEIVFVLFFVEDHDFLGAPPSSRFEVVSRDLAAVVEQTSDGWPAFRQVWRSRADRRSERLQSMPTRVEFDNTTLKGQTIIDLFAHDRVDLMYTITRILHRFGAQVHLIKSGPYVDQVVDVFYVTDLQGKKIDDDQRLNELRLLLLTAVENE